jgi:hypothetical protein
MAAKTKGGSNDARKTLAKYEIGILKGAAAYKQGEEVQAT